MVGATSNKKANADETNHTLTVDNSTGSDSNNDTPDGAVLVTFDMDGDDDDDEDATDAELGGMDRTELSDLSKRWSNISGAEEEEDDDEGSNCTGLVDSMRSHDSKKLKEADNDATPNSLLAPRTQLARQILVGLYAFITVLITILSYFLAEAASRCDDTSPFDVIPPIAIALLVAFGFAVVGGVAVVYDALLQAQLEGVHKSATKSKEIVASLFPKQFRDQLLEEAALKNTTTTTSAAQSMNNNSSSSSNNLLNALNASKTNGFTPLPKARLKNFLDHEGHVEEMNSGSRPIADLFPSATVLFADISGFTAWSSEREPVQVFFLLESLYKAFDRIARRFGVFKVETVSSFIDLECARYSRLFSLMIVISQTTPLPPLSCIQIGDCYMCVTGLPDPQPDHAIRMVRFAKQIIRQMHQIVKELERSLGPDTGDLRLRVGANSGPVTAGVLRGEKSRFQLFGDTVNTASRMESTGERNRIQLWQSTADLLIQAGKEEWITPRPDLVSAKVRKGTKIMNSFCCTALTACVKIT